MLSSARVPDGLRSLLRRTVLRPRVPAMLARRFTPVLAAGRETIRQALLRDYFGKNDRWFQDGYLDTAEGRLECEQDITGRLQTVRERYIPWFNQFLPLQGARVLEIGCGTGIVSVAFAEQGASVTGVDIDPANLRVARERGVVHGLDVRFQAGSATDVKTMFSGECFDLIVFFASLEHMTCTERLQSIRDTWGMLADRGCWSVVETPNRLWVMDNHTSHLPFFAWLPDELAYRYSRYSPREALAGLYGDEATDGTMLDFQRRGRGMSYHEIELALDRDERFEVVSSLALWERRRNRLRGLLWSLTSEARFEELLRRFGPPIHRGFYQQSLNLLLRPVPKAGGDHDFTV